MRLLYAVTITNSSVVSCQGIAQCLESGHPVICSGVSVIGSRYRPSQPSCLHCNSVRPALYSTSFFLQVYEMSSVKDNWGRSELLNDWHSGGGVMIMGYEMFRNLSQLRRVRNKKQKKVFTETLLDPGKLL
jgi:hypothetical protein